MAKRKNFDTSTGLIDVLIKAHDQTNTWQNKRQILSLFANDFSRIELQKLIPGLSKRRIDQARQHAIEAGEDNLFTKIVFSEQESIPLKLIISSTTSHDQIYFRMSRLGQKLLN